jgi:hypothetical protein
MTFSRERSLPHCLSTWANVSGTCRRPHTSSLPPARLNRSTNACQSLVACSSFKPDHGILRRL